MDRANMLNGNALQWVKRTIAKPPTNVCNTRILPADLDGASPSAGSPGIFSRTVAATQDTNVSIDRLETYEFDVNWAYSTSDDGDNDEAHVDTTVAAIADLWIDKTGGFITQNPGKNILYTLTVHNDSGCSGHDPQVCGDGGPSDAQNVVVFDQLPATNKKLVVTFVSEDCLYDYGSHTVTCVTPTLAAGDTVFHQIEATPKGRLRAITNIVDVTSDTTDPDTGNNHNEMLMIVGGGGQKGTGE